MLEVGALPTWLAQIEKCTTIPALTLTQPWTTLMALEAKRTETRSWATLYRGILALHAAKGYPEWAEDCCDEEPFKQVLQEGGYVRHSEDRRNPWRLPLGQVVAIGMLEQVQRITETFQVSDTEREFGNYAPGRFAWSVPTIYRLATEIPARGSLGLWAWNPPDSFWEEIQAVYEQGERVEGVKP